MELTILALVGMVFAFMAGYAFGLKPDEVIEDLRYLGEKAKGSIRRNKIKVIPFKELKTAQEETFAAVEKKFKEENND